MDSQAELSEPLQALYAQAMEQLTALQSSATRKDATPQEVTALRVAVRTALQTLLLEAPALALAQHLELKLWKNCFYVPIREFRGQLARAQRGDPAAAEELAKGFAGFLQDGALFYMGLLRHLDLRRQAEDPTSRTDTVASILACLVYAGDIARYGAQYASSDGGSRSWEKARSCYDLALRVAPGAGNPYNQLGVVAFQAGDDFEAGYCYMRALLASEPFPSAAENLAAVLAKLRGADAPPGPSQASCLHKLLKIVATVQAFDLVQVRGDSAADATLRSLPPLIRAATAELTSLLKQGRVADALLLKIYVVCIFGLARSAAEPKASRRVQAALGDELQLLKTIAFLALATTTFNAVLEVYNRRLESITPGEGIAQKSILGGQLLGPSAVFAQVLLSSCADSLLGINARRLEPTPANAFGSFEGWDAAALTALAESSSWAAIRSLRATQGLLQGFPAGMAEKVEVTAALPEHATLEGFSPAAPFLTSIPARRPVGLMRYSLPILDQAAACSVRVAALRNLEPPPGYGVEPGEDTGRSDGMAGEGEGSEDSDDSDDEDIVFSVGGAAGRVQSQDLALRMVDDAEPSGGQTAGGDRQPGEAVRARASAERGASDEEFYSRVESAREESEGGPNGVQETKASGDAREPHASVPFARRDGNAYTAWMGSNPFGAASGPGAESGNGHHDFEVPPGFELA